MFYKFTFGVPNRFYSIVCIVNDGLQIDNPRIEFIDLLINQKSIYHYITNKINEVN